MAVCSNVVPVVLTCPLAGSDSAPQSTTIERRDTYLHISLVPRPPPFLPSVCVHNNTQERKTGVLIFIDLPIPCIIVNANGRSKQGRPGTKAIYI